VAVEIGVDEADTSAKLLAALPSLEMLLVDPYHLLPGLGPAAVARKRRVFDSAAERTQAFRDRATFILQTGVQAARHAANESLDLVFVDGDHLQEAVSADISAWWPAVRRGGILAGHDYTGRDLGVVRAANDFAVRVDLPLQLAPEMWWLEKPL